jgi:hypothetical protein
MVFVCDLLDAALEDGLIEIGYRRADDAVGI